MKPAVGSATAGKAGPAGKAGKSGKAARAGKAGKAAKAGKPRKAPKAPTAQPAGAAVPPSSSVRASKPAAAPGGDAPRRPRALAVDLLPAGMTGLGGAWIAAVSLWTLIMGGGIGRAWAPLGVAVGVLSLRCAYVLIVGAPPMWLMFAQACALRIASDVMDWALVDNSGRLPWRGWVAWVGVWGLARALNLYLRRRAAARV